jgi:hypothetical protein
MYMVRKYLLIIGCVLGLFTSKIYSQATTTLSIDSFSILNTFVYGDTAYVGVQVRVLDGFMSDTLVGDIYYYYLTDSMISAGDSAQIIELDGIIQSVADPFWDVVHIPINTGEMKTGPLNLIVVWPAMMDPAVLDTDSVVINLILGHDVGIEPEYVPTNENILYPSPAMHYIFIKPEEIDLIQQMIILNMQGQTVETIPGEKLSYGWISIDHLSSGAYLAILKYKDGKMIKKKILKE